MADSDIKQVQMNLRTKTLERVENLKKRMHTDNRTQIVTNSIAITDELLKMLEEGGELYIEKGDQKINLKLLGTV